MSDNDHTPRKPMRYRSVFVSDVYLGATGSRADKLAAFHKHRQCEHLYRVGDMIDAFMKLVYWGDLADAKSGKVRSLHAA